MAIRTDWLGNQDLTGQNWFDVAQRIRDAYGPSAIQQLLDANFFEQFPSFSAGDRASLWNWVGAETAKSQDDGGGFVSDLVNPGGILGSGFIKGYAELDPVTKGGINAATGAANNFDQGNVKDPLGAVASFTGSEETQPIDWGANPLTAQKGGDTLELARLGGKLMAGYGLATAAGAGSGAAEAAAGGSSGGAAAPAGVTYGTAAGDAATIYGTGTATGGGVAGLAGATGTAAAAPSAVSGASGAEATGALSAGGGAVTGGTTLGGAGFGSSLMSNPSLIGGLGGAALGALSGTGSKSNTIQTEEGIPDWLMPYVKPTLDKYSTDVQNYNVDPYGIMPSAMQQFQKTIQGDFLSPDSNPYLNDYFRLGAERIKGSLSPTFGHMQAFGQHSGYNEALARGLGDFSVQLYGGAYDKERERQNQLTAAAPAFLGQNSQAQFQPFSQYLSSVGSLGKSKESPYFTNPFSSILGGAMVGSQFGKMF